MKIFKSWGTEDGFSLMEVETTLNEQEVQPSDNEYEATGGNGASSAASSMTLIWVLLWSGIFAIWGCMKYKKNHALAFYKAQLDR
jgi:hypothetical protein